MGAAEGEDRARGGSPRTTRRFKRRSDRRRDRSARRAPRQRAAATARRPRACDRPLPRDHLDSGGGTRRAARGDTGLRSRIEAASRRRSACGAPRASRRRFGGSHPPRRRRPADGARLRVAQPRSGFPRKGAFGRGQACARCSVHACMVAARATWQSRPRGRLRLSHSLARVARDSRLHRVVTSPQIRSLAATVAEAYAFLWPGPPSFPLFFDPNVNWLIGPMTVSLGGSYVDPATASILLAFVCPPEASIGLAALLSRWPQLVGAPPE